MPQATGPKNLTILDYWRIVWRVRIWLAALVIMATFSTWVVCKLSPRQYEAKASLLPIKEDTLSGGGLSLGGGGGGGGSRGGGGGSSGGGGASMVMGMLGSGGPSLLDTMKVIMESRALASRVVDQLNLLPYYGVESKDDAIQILRGEVKGKANESKALDIVVTSHDPAMAASIANAYFANLEIVYKEFSITATRRNREFIEVRLAEKAKKLDEAEHELKEFQAAHHLVVPQFQTEGAVETAANLHAEITAHEVELAALKSYETSLNPEVIQLEVQIQELRRQLDKLEQGPLSGFDATRKTKRMPLSKKIYPLFEEAPQLALDMQRLTRRVKVEEAVYGMLAGMLESAKITEARDVPAIQIMDYAIPPKFPSKPKTLQNMVAASALSLILGIMMAIFLDYLQRIKAEETSAGSYDAIMGTSDQPHNGHGEVNGSHEAREAGNPAARPEQGQLRR